MTDTWLRWMTLTSNRWQHALTLKRFRPGSGSFGDWTQLAGVLRMQGRRANELAEFLDHYVEGARKSGEKE